MGGQLLFLIQMGLFNSLIFLLKANLLLIDLIQMKDLSDLEH